MTHIEVAYVANTLLVFCALTKCMVLYMVFQTLTTMSKFSDYYIYMLALTLKKCSAASYVHYGWFKLQLQCANLWI